MDFDISSIAYIDSASVNGVAFFDVYASILWHSASNPTLAKTFFGIVFIQSGSTIDTFAIIAPHLSDFLSPVSGFVSTANPFPSEPVPQVVGIRTIGSADSLYSLLNM